MFSMDTCLHMSCMCVCIRVARMDVWCMVHASHQRHYDLRQPVCCALRQNEECERVCVGWGGGGVLCVVYPGLSLSAVLKWGM